MMFTDKSSSSSVPKNGPKKKKKKTRPQGLPSPALCCACGLCIMLAGINITLVGAFAFSTFLPRSNPPIVIGPVLLLVAFAFFGACCVCSRRPPSQGSRRRKGGAKGGGGGDLGLIRSGGVALELETSEHTLQETTAVQLSPTNSPGSSRRSSPSYEAASSRACKLFATETNGLPSVCYSASLAGEAVQLSLPRDPAAS